MAFLGTLLLGRWCKHTDKIKETRVVAMITERRAILVPKVIGQMCGDFWGIFYIVLLCDCLFVVVEIEFRVEEELI